MATDAGFDTEALDRYLTTEPDWRWREDEPEDPPDFDEEAYDAEYWRWASGARDDMPEYGPDEQDDTAYAAYESLRERLQRIEPPF